MAQDKFKYGIDICREEKLYICDNMLKDDEDVFLDNITVEELSEKLNIEIVIIFNNGRVFIDQLLGV